MEPIDTKSLASVQGGFAFLTALPGILSGISGIVSAFNKGGSSSAAPPTAQPQPPAAAPSPGPQSTGAPSTSPLASAPSGGGGMGLDSLGSIGSLIQNIIKIG